MRGGLGGANSEWSMPRGTMESSLTGTIGGRSPPDRNTYTERERESESVRDRAEGREEMREGGREGGRKRMYCESTHVISVRQYTYTCT